ncbi:carbohydrate ABC transporter permease [Enemella evansiae]|uniref:carbohydrate ABC transporter permease n=1 Tax=Enemella evansiae TaxID=2016499 RepID=UPI000B972D03|nr:sugar ABC transporter permease [Enemella evansiae]OYO14142.1 amino acid ABC transporter permease [Enemella evansiae]TDO91971.1 carbohydrate ABC transporter membrane protein 1 (CUT1 family) [Enemella evansiae]
MTATTLPPARRTRRHPWRSVPLLPAVILLAIFMVGPAIWSVYGSLTNTALTGRAARFPRFVGLANYERLFADPEFTRAILLTLAFTIGSAIVGQNVLGLTIAVLQRRAHRAVQTVVGTLVVAAWVMPEIVAAFAMYAFFQTDGSLNAGLGILGIAPIEWLYRHPMLAVILANIWRGTAFSMMVYSAALADIPDELTEAAAVDGASRRQTLFRITIPLIRRAIGTNLMLTTLQTLSVFTLIYVMTGGGPGTDSSTLPVLAYQTAFKFGEVGYGTAIATVMLVIGALFSLVYIRLLRSEVDR